MVMRLFLGVLISLQMKDRQHSLTMHGTLAEDMLMRVPRQPIFASLTISQRGDCSVPLTCAVWSLMSMKRAM